MTRVAEGLRAPLTKTFVSTTSLGALLPFIPLLPNFFDNLRYKSVDLVRVFVGVPFANLLDKLPEALAILRLPSSYPLADLLVYDIFSWLACMLNRGNLHMDRTPC